MDAGHLIAINLISLYALFGPLVLLGIYVLFDSLGNGPGPSGKNKGTPLEKKDPALWNSVEIDRFFDGL